MTIASRCAVFGLALASSAMAQVPSADYSWSVAYGQLVTAPTATSPGVFSETPGATAIGDRGATHARLRASMTLSNVVMNNINTGTPGTSIGGGQVSGLFFTAFDLLAMQIGSNDGVFSQGWIRSDFFRPTSFGGLLAGAGSVNGVAAVQLAQMPTEFQPLNQDVAFPEFWEIYWNPRNISARVAVFEQRVSNYPAGWHTQLIINTHPDPLTGFSPGLTQIPVNRAPVSIQIIPAPASIAAMGLGLGLASWRRR